MADTPYKGGTVPDWVTRAYPVHDIHGVKLERKIDYRLRPNPRCLPNQIVSILVSADRCAKCLGELDTGWECNECGFDWKSWMDESKALADAAHDRREG